MTGCGLEEADYIYVVLSHASARALVDGERGFGHQTVLSWIRSVGFSYRAVLVFFSPSTLNHHLFG